MRFSSISVLPDSNGWELFCAMAAAAVWFFLLFAVRETKALLDFAALSPRLINAPNKRPG